jgi:hypothetical protein
MSLSGARRYDAAVASYRPGDFELKDRVAFQLSTTSAAGVVNPAAFFRQCSCSDRMDVRSAPDMGTVEIRLYAVHGIRRGELNRFAVAAIRPSRNPFVQ